MIIKFPKIIEENEFVKLVVDFNYADCTTEIWYQVSSEYRHWLLPDRADAFVVGLLLQAMAIGEDIQIEAPISSKLYHSLKEFYIPMMAAAFPNLKKIKLHPAGLIVSNTGASGVATGFSGGIDSFATVVQHWQKEEYADHKISHFLFHNVGSHSTGNADAARRLFHQRYNTLKPFASYAQIPFIPVDSNISEIFPIDFIRMHSTLNASVLLALQGGFKRYYYASAYKYADCGVCKNDGIGRMDPISFHLLSTEQLDCVSTGCQMSRVEKTQLVAGFEPSRHHLNVCVDPAFAGQNCSVCFKCCRTIMTLELLGFVKDYSEVFDLAKYSKVRRKYLLKCLRYKKGSYESEIADLIQTNGSGWERLAFGLRHCLLN
jgi:hypothetical protein